MKGMNDMEIAWYNKALLDVQQIIGKMLDENANTHDDIDAHATLIRLDRAVIKLYLPHENKNDIT